MPKPEVVAFPKPPKAPDGSLLYDRIPNKPEAEKIPLNPPPAVVMTASSGAGTGPVGIPAVSVNAVGGPAALTVTPAAAPVAPVGIPTLGSTAGVTTGRNTPNAVTTIAVGSTNTPPSLKRRHYEDANGIDGGYHF